MHQSNSPPDIDQGEDTTRGYLDEVSSTLVRGWVWDSAEPDERLVVIVTSDDRVIARVLADRHRPDLEAVGIGDGRHGFELRLEPHLLADSAHLISVRKECDGKHLAGSPRSPTGSSVLSPEARQEIASRLSGACEDDELDARLTFVAEQLEALRRRKSATYLPVSQNYRDVVSGDGGRRRALVIDDTAPRGAHDAGSNAILSHVRSLQRLSFAVSFAPADLAHSDELERSGVDCWTSPDLGSVEEGLRRRAGQFDIVYLHRVSNASRYMALVRAYQPRACVVFSVADLHHIRLARQAEVEERPELARFGLHMRAEELTAAARADVVITHSSVEADLLRSAVPRAAVHIVPWAVPTRPTTIPFAQRRGFAFVAHYGHKPNVDAALWLVHEVLPALERLGFSISCLLVGTAMPDHLKSLQRARVEVVGAVEDLGTIFDRVRLTAAPLAFGAGLKGKVLDSLAAGVPCICSPVAVEGLHLPAPLSEQVSTNADQFAAKIAALHENPALNAACRVAGLAFVEAFASEANVDGLLREAVANRC